MKKKTWLLFAVFLLFIGVGSCTYKFYVNHNFRNTYTDMNEVIHMDTAKVDFFKVHFKSGDVWVLDDWSFSSNQDTLYGYGKLFDFNRRQIFEGAQTYHVDEIAIIETNELSEIKSMDKDRLSKLGILTGVNVAIDVVCLLNPKACFGSCPTFYLDGQSDIHGVNAEGFSNSIAPSLEEKDIDALDFKTSRQTIELTMKNEAMETHVVNQVTLLGVPTPEEGKVYHSRDDQFYLTKEVIPLSEARVNGQSILTTLEAKDGNEYFSKTDPVDLAAKEEIYLTFNEVPQGEIGMVISFRQTLVTTFLLYSALSYLGDEVADYFARIETSELLGGMIKEPYKRLGDIECCVWEEEKNQWVLFDALYETGPIATNLNISPVGIQSQTGPMRIKLVCAKGYWRLNYAALTRITGTVSPEEAELVALKTVVGKPYSKDIINTDDEDYVVAFPGDIYQLNYRFPALVEGGNYELFVASKGYYLEWMRKEWMEGKDLTKLKKMLLNHDDTWEELAREFKTVEHEMEEVFWNSAYRPIQ